MPMRRFLLGCLAVAGCLPVAAQSLNAEVEQIDASAYRIKITLPAVVRPDEAQALLAEAGAQLCSGQAFAWGHYEFETTQPPPEAKDTSASTRFTQDLLCGEPVARTGTPAPKTPATDADRHDVEARTLDYLVNKDKGDFAAADAMFDPEVLAQMNTKRWRDDRRAFNAAAGLPEKRSILGVTFYDDPADAPQLGRYAAVDYRASFRDRSFYCGYVLWLRQADGSYRLTREEESVAPDAEVRKLSAEQLATLRQQPGCREPEAAANASAQ
jgi:hypothetical protein